jgi:hypothetical protein
MPLAGFEPAIPAGDQLQTYPLDRTASGIGKIHIYKYNLFPRCFINLMIASTISRNMSH